MGLNYVANFEGKDNLSSTIKNIQDELKKTGQTASGIDKIQEKFEKIQNSSAPLKRQLRDLQAIMAKMNMNGLSNTSQFTEIAEYAGKLNVYVNAVDELMKQSDDNPTIGLLICSDMNKADVQWSFKGISTPMGVATYNNIRIKDMLPTQEQLKERMELLKKELKHTKQLMNKNSQLDTHY